MHGAVASITTCLQSAHTDSLLIWLAPGPWTRSEHARARAYKHRAYKHLLEQLLLLELQLQHDGVELHVQVVGSLQLPLVVLPDVQSMPAGRGEDRGG